MLKTHRSDFVTVNGAEVEIGHHSKERNALFVQRATEWSHKVVEAAPLRKFLHSSIAELNAKTSKADSSGGARLSAERVPLGKLPLGAPVAQYACRVERLLVNRAEVPLSRPAVAVLDTGTRSTSRTSCRCPALR